MQWACAAGVDLCSSTDVV